LLLCIKHKVAAFEDVTISEANFTALDRHNEDCAAECDDDDVPPMVDDDVDTEEIDDIFLMEQVNSDDVEETARRFVQGRVPDLHELQPKFTTPADDMSPRCFELTFFYLFRNGDGVIPEGLTERQFVDHCLRYHDRRFHKHVPFFFYCYFRQMRARVNQLAVMATNRDVGEPARAEEQYEPPNVEELLEAAVAACGKGAYADATKRAMKLASKLNSFGHCLPGTTAFMAMHRRQLHAALASGCMTPESYTWFFSHAANDLFWPEFFYMIDPDLQVSSLSKQQRRAYLAENPVLACLHYMDRLAAFQLHILRGRAPPLGPLTTQYHVNEDNQRLSNHTHSVAGTPAGGLIARDLARGDWSAGAAFLDAHVTANIGKPTPGFSLTGVKLRRGRQTPQENVDFNGLYAKLPEDINHPAFRPVALVPTSSPEGQADAQALQRALEVHRCYTYYCCQKGPCRFGAPWVLRPATQFVKVSKRRSGRFMPKRDNRYVNQCTTCACCAPGVATWTSSFLLTRTARWSM
jgi:hypothetical protein